MAFDLLRERASGTDGGGEDILPGEFLGSVGVFSFQGVRQRGFAKAFVEVNAFDA